KEVYQADLVLAGLEAVDRVAAQGGDVGGIVDVIDEQVLACPAIHTTGAEPAFDHGVAVIAVQQVRALEAAQRVAALAAVDDIGEVGTRDVVVEIVAGDREAALQEHGI